MKYYMELYDIVVSVKSPIPKWFKILEILAYLKNYLLNDKWV